MKRLGRFFRLPAADRRLLIASGVVLCLVRLGLWLLPFPRLRRVLAGFREARPIAAGANPVSVEHIVRAVRLTSRYVPAASCLTQALAAQILLARRGYASELQIGVARDGAGAFEAHAWLEQEGQVLIGSRKNMGRFAVLPPLNGERL